MCAAQEQVSDAGGAASGQPGIIPLTSDGWMGRPGLVGRRPDGTGWAPRLRVEGVDADAAGLRVDADASASGLDADESGSAPAAVATGGPGRVVVHLVDADTRIAVDLAVELLSQGLLRMRAELVNTAEETGRAAVDVYQLDELSLALPVPLTADQTLDFAGRWGRERDPQRTPVRQGCLLNEGRRGRTGFDAPTELYCGERGFGFERGRLWALHLAWSGNARSWLERTGSGAQVMGAGELLLPGEMALEPGESYRTPWLYAQYADGLDAAAAQLHAWQRTLPAHPGADRPVTLNVWEAVYFDHDLPALLELARLAASIGVERYVVDDGWFLGRRDDTRGLGDWTVDPQVWPDGLHPLAERVRELGMHFGLWVEPEMISPDSELARAHPEWILAARGDALPDERRHQQVLDLADPDAWEHIRGRLDALLDEYPISYLKWDHNRDLVDAGDQSVGGRAGVHAQTLACYRLMDRLRADHPGLEIESCSSGGGRIDLEMVTRAQRFWASDCIDPHERQSIVRWTEQLIAPEYVGTHIASPRSHTTGRVSDLSFRAATALWGHLGFEWDLRRAGDEDLSRLREWVGFYKEHRRNLLSGRLVRRDVADGSLWLHGVVAPDGASALYELACLERSPMSPRGTFTLPGLRPETLYRVRPVLVGGGPSGLGLPGWGDGVVTTGAALGSAGLAAPTMYPDQAVILEATAT